MFCRDDGMPRYGTVRDWVRHDRNGFAAPYRAALRAGGVRSARPIRYAADIADVIVDGLGKGYALEEVCADPGMPTPTAVRHWVEQDRDGFAARYWRAREVGCDTLADKLLISADDRSGSLMERRRKDGTTERVVDRTYVRRARLRCDVIQWQLSRRLRDTYGSRARRQRGDR
jgi:hypothetical protein